MYGLQEYDTWFWVSFKGMRNFFLLFPCLHRICRFHIFSLTFPDCRCYVLPKFNDVPSSIPSFLWVYKNLTIHFSTIDLPNKFSEFIPPLKKLQMKLWTPKEKYKTVIFLSYILQRGQWKYSNIYSPNGLSIFNLH